MLIDRFMSEWHFSERHSLFVSAPPEVVFGSIQGLKAAEVPAFRVLMGIRSLPARFGRSRPADPSRPLLDAMSAAGFKVLFQHAPTEAVIGVVGRFWKLRPPPMRDFGDAQGFIDFAEPGYAKAVMNFHVWPEGEGSTLSTETRVKATDEETRKLFARYWRVIGPGSAAIRRNWLGAARKNAESRAAG
jgi:hypothetical protein